MTWFSTAAWFVQSPWMLFALLSLIVPLVIHLLSKSKGKLIPIGNIKLIQLSKPVRMNEVRLVERLLLLCRLLLLFFSVLLLAQLYYDDRENNVANREGHILVTKDWLNHANASDLNQLALKAKVGTVYLLSTKNERLTNEKILFWKDNQLQEQQNTWILVSNYIKTLPNSVKVTVYSTNRLSQFIGDKVHLPDHISWLIKKLPADELTTSINELSSKAISVLIIGDEDSKEEISYVNAALSILKENKLKNLTFTFQDDNYFRYDSTNNQTIKYESFDWIFYLSSAPVPASILEEVNKGTKLIADTSHSENNNTTHLVRWSELATHLQFPQVLLSLLLDESLQNYQLQQQLTNEQIKSQLVNNAEVSSAPLLFSAQFKNPFIDKLLILLLVIFWAIERVLSEIKKTKQSSVTKSSSDSTTYQKIKRNR